MVFHNNNLWEDLSYSFPPPRSSVHLLIRHELEDEAVLMFASIKKESANDSM